MVALEEMGTTIKSNPLETGDRTAVKGHEGREETQKLKFTDTRQLEEEEDDHKLNLKKSREG